MRPDTHESAETEPGHEKTHLYLASLYAPHLSQRRTDGAVVIVQRGNCTWPTKAANVEAAGGKLVLVVNTDSGKGCPSSRKYQALEQREELLRPAASPCMAALAARFSCVRY